MLTPPMRSGDFEQGVSRRWLASAVFGLAFFVFLPLIHAQPDLPDEMSGESPVDDEVTGTSTAADGGGDALVCDGGWRYQLNETRQEFGPARFARQTELQSDIALVSQAFAYCELSARSSFVKAHARSAGPCYGMLRLAGTVDVVASNLFQIGDKRACECVTQNAEAQSSCEGLREQLTVLRRYGEMIVDRAELVLAHEVCASVERNTNGIVRAACDALDKSVVAEHNGGKGKPGQFSLAAPLPPGVAKTVDGVRTATDGRYLSVVPENFIGVRDSICRIESAAATTNSCELSVLDMGTSDDEPPKPDATPTEIWGKKRQEVMWGMCNELALADVNANTCRSADVYIDERGELHLNRPLRTREQRRDATMCIDVSDFDQAHPLMVTLGMDPTSSVPERIWPGETMHIGSLIDRPVKPTDILRIHVLGKARGISLSEVLRVNGVPGYTGETRAVRNSKTSRDEACRIARSWVPVVDHEVPVGTPNRQSVIPMDFGRGRDGETPDVEHGNYVVLWVRNIEPSGSVLAEYARGQTVGYQPPPLLGEPADIIARVESPDGLMNPDAELRGTGAGVGQPLLPRRARYPGSRVLRLGTPEGNQLYNLRVCTRTGPAGESEGGERTCDNSGDAIVLQEKLFVSGDYHFGVRVHFGYTYFPVSRLVGRRTPAAEAAGDGFFEVVEDASGTADYDVAALLAIYPFGRNPRQFSYKPWTKDYWKHTALLTGFSMRSFSPWNDFYLGGSIPVANGVSLSALSHFSRRQVPVDASSGDLVGGGGGETINLNNFYDTQSALVVGVSVGISVDFDLFERAFTNIWERFTSRSGQFVNSAP